VLDHRRFILKRLHPAMQSPSTDRPDVDAWPSWVSDRSKGGFLEVAGRRLNYLVDGDDSGSYVFTIDLNVDGDLSNDRVYSMVRADRTSVDAGLPQVLVDESLNGLEDGLRLTFKLVLEPNRGTARMYTETLRSGDIALGECHIAFTVQGLCGTYGASYNRVYFDVDGDGRVDVTQRESDESYSVGERFVNLWGESYEFHVDRLGERLTLQPLGRWLPDRDRLSSGNRAPAFAFKDIDGKSGTLLEYRGQIVLLYFWDASCPPCLAATRRLVEVHGALHTLGFDVLAVNDVDSTDVVRSHIQRNDVPWRQVVEGEDGPISRLYRVEAHPSYFLIDREGTIIGRTVDGLESQVGEALR
jgi:peroxiredoxin